MPSSSACARKPDELQCRLVAVLTNFDVKEVCGSYALQQLCKEDEDLQMVLKQAGGVKALCEGFDWLRHEDVNGDDWLVLEVPPAFEKLKCRLLGLLKEADGNRLHAGSGLGRLYKEDVEFKAIVQKAGSVKGLCQMFGGLSVEDNWILANTVASPTVIDASLFDELGEVSVDVMGGSRDICPIQNSTQGIPTHHSSVVPKSAASRDLLSTIRISSTLRILEVGSGDGSHPLSYVNDLPDPSKLVVTCYDTRLEAEQKYPARDGPSAQENFKTLEEKGARLVFGVDATQLSKSDLGTFDVAIFYFPHTGVQNAQKEECIRSNRDLISGFLQSVKHLLAENGEVHIALKTNDIYAEWNIEELITDAGMKKTYDFELNKEEFPDYAHRMTLGSKGSLIQVKDRGARVYLCEPDDVLLRMGAARQVCESSVRLRITCIDSDTDSEVASAVLLLLQDSSAPQNVLEIRRSLQSAHDTRQLNRVLSKLVDSGDVRKIHLGKGKPKYEMNALSHDSQENSSHSDSLHKCIIELLQKQAGALDTLQVAKGVGLRVQKDVRAVLQQLADQRLVEQVRSQTSARPSWRMAGA